MPPMTATRERRLFTIDHLQFRAADPANPTATRKITGHAAVFGKPAEIWPGFIEDVRAGAFTESIAADDIRGLFNHNPDYVLGRNVAGTMRLSEDATGLLFEIDPPGNSYDQDLERSIARGDISQCSFSFNTLGEEVSYEGETIRRTLTKVKLYDVGPVTFPAYPETDVGMRSLEQVAEECRRTLAARGVDPMIATRRRHLQEIEAGIR